MAAHTQDSTRAAAAKYARGETDMKVTDWMSTYVGRSRRTTRGDVTMYVLGMMAAIPAAIVLGMALGTTL